jgi:REP element-mobilizing transposase RayT
MPHALVSNLMHCVFSTKDRKPTIPDPVTLGRYFGGIAREKNIPLILAGGTSNHVHLLIALPASIALAKAIQDLKGNSSRWIGLHQTEFGWQQGYSGFSVSPTYKRAVMAYINGQERHHAKQSFEEELISMLEKAEIEYDKRYIFG